MRNSARGWQLERKISCLSRTQHRISPWDVYRLDAAELNSLRLAFVKGNVWRMAVRDYVDCHLFGSKS